MMKLNTFILFAFLALSSPVHANPSDNLRNDLNQYCTSCHGQNKVKGKVNLLKAFDTTTAKWTGDSQLIEKIINALENHEMPPEDEDKQPSDEQRTQWIKHFKSLLNASFDTSRITNPPIRRMTRLEYNNAVKDLFELTIEPFPLTERIVQDYQGYFQPAIGKMPDIVIVGNRALGKSQFTDRSATLSGVAMFPKDNQAEHGFSNQSDHITLSPVLMESFFSLSQSILNSLEFDKHCGTWQRLFAAPEKTNPAQLPDIARQRLSTFLYHAFRSPVDQKTVTRYHQYFMRQFKATGSFAESMKAATAAALVSPRFLYIYTNPNSQSSSANLSDYQLASRMSFFLWSSIPDHELLSLAEKGTLHHPRILNQQITRMLNSPKTKNFCDNFALQWLKLDSVVSAQPDETRYRDYYYSGINKKLYRMGMHMMIEPLLTFETIYVENRPITQLIDANFTYRSQMLSHWYDPSLKRGPFEVLRLKFKRIPLHDRRWGGVITNAGVLTMTSSPLRTKPITRGAWLVSTIFNNPPKPPPADVPELDDDDTKIEKSGKTLREKLKAHQINQDCATCHQKIDPHGFVLENYDAVGRWRDQYRTGLPIDATGKLFNKYHFNNIIEYKDTILKEKPRFARAFASYLLSYSLGRVVDVNDRPSIDKIVSESANDNFRMRTMIKQVMLSDSFLQPTNEAKSSKGVLP